MSMSPESDPARHAYLHTSHTSPDDSDSEVQTQDQDQDQGQPPPQKRKGGRKPIYATSEERKQRNRQAQAAFRERRTEYIKQLEVNLKQNEDSMASMRQTQRSSAEECNVLRYHNSMLETIMTEKGIDVQAELYSRGASPNARSQHNSPASPRAPIMHQAIMSQHQQTQIQPSGLPQKYDSEYGTPQLHSLQISPASASATQTPSSSRFSSPSSGYSALPQHMSPAIARAGHPGQQQFGVNYNYVGYPAMMQSQAQASGSEQHMDVSKFGYQGYQGYHTSMSMGDSLSSRHSSMAPTNLDPEESRFPATGTHAVDSQRPKPVSYEGGQAPPERMQSFSSRPASQYIQQQQLNPVNPQGSTNAYMPLYRDPYHGMLSQETAFAGYMFGFPTTMHGYNCLEVGPDALR